MLLNRPVLVPQQDLMDMLGLIRGDALGLLITGKKESNGPVLFGLSLIDPNAVWLRLCLVIWRNTARRL